MSIQYDLFTATPLKPALNAEDKIMTEKFLDDGHLEYKYAVRLRVILRRANGKTPKEIAGFFNVHINSVAAYTKRYNTAGIDSLLHDKTRKPGMAPVAGEIRNRVTDIACHEKPKDATHRSTRKLAKRVGISHDKVAEIPREAGVKPHIQSYYSYSSDPNFEEKLRDIAGLYIKTRLTTR